MSQDHHPPYGRLPLEGGRGSLALGCGGQAAAVQGAAYWPIGTFPPFSEEALLGGEDVTKLGPLAAAGCSPDGRMGRGWHSPGLGLGVFLGSSGSQDGWDCLVRREEGVFTGWGPRRGGLVWDGGAFGPCGL